MSVIQRLYLLPTLFVCRWDYLYIINTNSFLTSVKLYDSASYSKFLKSYWIQNEPLKFYDFPDISIFSSCIDFILVNIKTKFGLISIDILPHKIFRTFQNRRTEFLYLLIQILRSALIFFNFFMYSAVAYDLRQHIPDITFQLS